jgi:transposase
MPECPLPSVDQSRSAASAGCPYLNQPTGKRPLKKKTPLIKKKKTPELTPSPEVELYAAPKPPKRGRIIGVDCHPDTYTAAVFVGQTPHDARKVGARDQLNLEQLLAWVEGEFTPEDLFLLEAGSNSFEVHHRLLALGLRAVVMESCYVGRQAKIYADNDRMAAARMVLVYLAGKAPCVWVPDELSSQRRQLLHAHQMAVAKHTAAVNALKSYLNQFAIRLGKRGLHSESTRQWVLTQRRWSSLQRELLADYFAQVDQEKKRRQQWHRRIAQEVANDPLMLRCLKLLGIGLINAFALLAIIGDVRRFTGPKKLVAYVGLNPGQRDSGQEKRIKIGVGRRGRGDLRHLLIQGAQAVLRAGRQTTLGQWGWKLFARKGHRHIAVAAVARKLLVQVWHVLWEHPAQALETSKSVNLKLHKLAVVLGKSLRVELGLPAQLKPCLLELQKRFLQPCAT